MINWSSNPVRGGSTTRASKLSPSFCQRGRTSSALPASYLALVILFNLAFSLASATASGIISIPRTAFTRDARERPIVPIPAYASIKVSSLSSSRALEASSYNTSVCSGFSCKKERAESLKSSPIKLSRIESFPARWIILSPQTKGVSPGLTFCITETTAGSSFSMRSSNSRL
ncbi:hypothetical protein LRLP16767_LR202_00927 [Limosilactobacillus reuteri]|uniref:Uncharacterized protein n=1 Tax=Limosilactobacillus reuteri TaxID=1598 RepID=A0A0U5KJZ7_LIMRT|nr:hypothetical protein LRLP16767_LR3C6_00592 [Limosilactobacillus reuteri subsp. porcinus]CUR40868.1 hypothetical protein LRLP16767_LR202_00927 [Limosilactobacillus reuteri]